MIHVCWINRIITGMLWTNVVVKVVVKDVTHPGVSSRCKVLYYKYESNQRWKQNTNNNVIFVDQVNIDKSYDTEEEFIADNFGDLI